jgi:hypothetical protein
MFGNYENMPPSLVRFARGFLFGTLVGAALLTLGLGAWGIALVTGAAKDDSTHGISLWPVYVLSFGLGGGVVGMFEADRVKSIKSMFAWVFAVVIVLSGCVFLACLLNSPEPVDWVWGAGSGAALLVMVSVGLVIVTLNKRGRRVARAG